jgi:hypothetical protein
LKKVTTLNYDFFKLKKVRGEKVKSNESMMFTFEKYNRIIERGSKNLNKMRRMMKLLENSTNLKLF